MRYLYCLAIVFLFYFSPFSAAQANHDKFRVSIFTDKKNTLDIESVKGLLTNDSKLFIPSDSLKGPLDPNVTYWFYIQHTDTNNQEHYVLSFHLWVSHVEVYPFPYTSVSAFGGRMVPGRLKELPGGDVNLKNDGKPYLVKVQNRIYSAASVKNFEIVPSKTFQKKKEKDDFIKGIILGFLWLMLLYNLILFIMAKNKIHLYYVLYILFSSLFFLFAFHYSEVYLFPDNYKLNHVLLTFQLIGTFFYTMFIRTVLIKHCSTYSDAFDKKFLLPFAFIMLIVNIIIGSTAFFRMDIYMVAQGLSNLFAGSVAIGIFIYHFRGADRFFKLIMAGSVILFLFGWTNVAFVLFFIGSFDMFYEVGLIVELLIFTYALNKLRMLDFEERCKAELMKNNLENELEAKNRELMYKSIQISAKDELLSSIILKIKNLVKPGHTEKLTLPVSLFNYSMEDNLWNEFEIHFKNTHPGFYKTLLEKYPQLTQNELRLCAFLRLNFTTKEIARITKKSEHSIEVMRSRLRFKMHLQREDNLNQILSQI